MRLPFPETVGYRRKQVLAGEIAAAYMQQFDDIVDDASKIPERANIIISQIGHDYVNEDEGQTRRLGALVVTDIISGSLNYVNEARRYAQLANSLFLYFRTEQGLTKLLEKVTARMASMQ